MREILFRGKRLDNGEWVYGSYYHCCGTAYGATFIVVNDFGFIEVIPHTVGQYTGLTDKNGKKIYEGDITQYDKDGALYEIVFVKEGGKTQFCSKFIPDGSLGYVNEGRDKVIGNIHDNPELLELKAKVYDTIYMPWIYDGESGVCNIQVCAVHFLIDGSVIYATDLDEELGEQERGFLSKYHYGNFSQEDFGLIVFTNKEEAEYRLAELKGGK